MKKIFITIAIATLFAACKKEDLYSVYTTGTRFDIKGKANGEGAQTGVIIIADTNSYWISRHVKPDTTIIPTEPYIIDRPCPECFPGQMGYFCHSTNHLNYEIAESDIKIVN